MAKDTKHYLFAYGSLLSDDSRRRHSSLAVKPVPATLSGWTRGWFTRAEHEQQTYVGAVTDSGSTLNGVLLPVAEIDPKLQKREQDYTFEQVDVSQLNLHLHSEQLSKVQQNLFGGKIWVCRTREQRFADTSYPVYQSYIDTCLSGCFESGVEAFADQFIHSTSHWHAHIVNDRAKARYPRAAAIGSEVLEKIDSLLKRHGVGDGDED